MGTISRVTVLSLVALGLLAPGCLGAPDDEEDATGDVSTDEQALHVGDFVGTPAIQVCIKKQVCNWECVEPPPGDDIVRCGWVCQTVCVPA